MYIYDKSMKLLFNNMAMFFLFLTLKLLYLNKTKYIDFKE